MNLIDKPEALMAIGILLMVTGGLGVIPFFSFRNKILKYSGISISVVVVIAGIVAMAIGDSGRQKKAKTELSDQAKVAQQLLSGEEVSLQTWLNFFPPGSQPAAFDSVVLELKLSKNDACRIRSVGHYRVRIETNMTALANNKTK